MSILRRRAIALATLLIVIRPAFAEDTTVLRTYSATAGRLLVHFPKSDVQTVGLDLIPDGLRVQVVNGQARLLPAGNLIFGEALTVPGEAPLDGLVLRVDTAGETVVVEPRTGQTIFGLYGVEVDVETDRRRAVLHIAGRLHHLADKSAPGRPIASLTLTAPLELDTAEIIEHGTLVATVQPPRQAQGGFPTPGPDVIVGSLPLVSQFGRQGDYGNGMVGLGISTTSCNKGTTSLHWFPLPNTDHPLIAQNLYRMSAVDGVERFEQIGWSWLKHGFSALQQNTCDFGCTNSGSSVLLGPGCSDPYSSSLNGFQCGLGPRAVANPYTGEIPEGDLLQGGVCTGQNYPSRDHRVHDHGSASVAHRVQVYDVDLIPELNPQARYFSEGQYISAHEYDDPTSYANQNMHNNVAHTEVAVTNVSPEGIFTFSNVASTVPEEPAADEWTAAVKRLIEPEPGVDGRAFLYYEVTDLGDDRWHYEYALYNMNLDRAISSLSVPLGSGVNTTDVGFHAPPNHDDAGVAASEQYSNDPWDVDTSTALTWSTIDHATDPQANAVRFGTLYNFRFVANSPPESVDATVEFFKTGEPLLVPTVGPSPILPAVCGDGVAEQDEECDPPDGVSCDESCQWICGDGTVQDGEECDPPDDTHCDATCQWICGDGQIQDGEECDPPNGVDCDNDCQIIEFCGNDIIDKGEECDPPDGVTCDDSCLRIPICGDGFVDGDTGEQCDDGNVVPGDGCDENCQNEFNDDCTNAWSIQEGVLFFSTVGASTDGPPHKEACEQSSDGGQTFNDIWYLYSATCSGQLIVSTCNDALFNTDLVLYDGTDCNDLQLLDCNDNAILCGVTSKLAADVVAGRDYLIRVGGWNIGDSGVGEITVTNDGIPCTIVSIVDSFPPAESIDARQPTDPTGEDVFGWSSIELTFSADAGSVIAADFEIILDPAGPDVPEVDGIQTNGDVVRVTLDRPIPPGVWTTVEHVPSATSVRIGYLPGDVNGNGVANPQDILALVDHLNGVSSLATFSTDLNRSGLTEAGDILRLVDLLNGAGEYDEWNGQSLP